MSFHIRELTGTDRDVWANMREALWPFMSRAEHLQDIDWTLARDNYWSYLVESAGAPLGFAEVSLRDYANGCTHQPVPFLEGIWIAPEHRRQGAGAALIQHIAESFSARGFTEICSDALFDNLASHAAHADWGFAETERVVYFRKSLAPNGR